MIPTLKPQGGEWVVVCEAEYGFRINTIIDVLARAGITAVTLDDPPSGPAFEYRSGADRYLMRVAVNPGDAALARDVLAAWEKRCQSEVEKTAKEFRRQVITFVVPPALAALLFVLFPDSDVPAVVFWIVVVVTFIVVWIVPRQRKRAAAGRDRDH